MANLDRIVNVQISLNTTAIAQQSFSDLLIVGPMAGTLARVLIITAADDLLEYGVTTTDPLYRAATNAFQQTPHINQVYIGRKRADSVTVTVDTAAQTTYTITLSWRDAQNNVQTQNFTYSATSGETVAEIAMELEELITASGAPVTVTISEGVLTIAPATAGDSISVIAKGNMTAAITSSTESYTNALAAIRQENNDWYGLAIVSRVDSDVMAAADWAEANEKLFGAASAQPGILDAAVVNDIASQVKNANYFRTHLWYHANAAAEFPECAVMSRLFTYYPGQETWANKRLSGITTDMLTETQASVARSKNCNTFEQFRNFSITQLGKVAAGEWIDVIRFRDWLAEQIQINVASALINADGKVPYTDAGIQLIGMQIQKALDLGVQRNGIAPQELDEFDHIVKSYVITLPRNANIAFNDKANRVLNDVKFTARLAGAIHVVNIQGSLSYEL